MRFLADACTLLALIGLIAAGCGLYADVEPPPETPPVDQVGIQPSEATLSVGEAITIELTKPNGNPVPPDQIEWTSDDETIATVDQKGKVEGTGPGDVEIEANWRGAVKTAELDVELDIENVTIVPPESLENQNEPYTVQYKRSVTFGADVTGPNDTELADLVDVTWETGDDDIAEIGDAPGKVTAVGGQGDQTVVTAKAGGTQDTVQVRVDVPVAGIVAGDDRRLAIGEVRCVEATPLDVDDEGLAGKQVSWTSGDPDVVTVDRQGKQTANIEAVGKGSTTITASSGEASASFGVTVAKWKDEAAGAFVSCGLTTAGTGYCWGGNKHGKLGDGTTDSHIQPERVSAGSDQTSLPTFTEIEAGFHHVCALTDSSSLYCWGDNRGGQTGTGSNDSRHTRPREVQVSSPLASISLGAFHSCAVTNTGQTLCWGSNACGQTGSPAVRGGSQCDGQTIVGGEPTTPTAVMTDQTFETVSAGRSHTCGLTSQGEIMCWGRAVEGQLGNGAMQGVTPDPDGEDKKSYGTPQMIELTDPNVGNNAGTRPTAPFEDVEAGFFHTCAIDANHNIWCWGDNSEQVAGPYCEYEGDNQTASKCARPSLVPFRKAEPTELYRGAQHMCLTTENGTAYCWGRGGGGELGNGGATNSDIPVEVSTNAAFQSVSSGPSSHNCATTDQNQLVCWGFNNKGQIGNGEQGDGVASTTPVPIQFASACSGRSH